MSDPLDRIDTSSQGLKQLLDFHYVLILINFGIFSDLMVAVLLKQPLLLAEFGTRDNKITIGLVILILIAFAIYLFIVKVLFSCCIRLSIILGSYISKMKIPQIMRKILFPDDYVARIKATIATYSMTEEYAIKTNNYLLLSVCSSHKEEIEKRQNILFMLFGLSLLLLISAVFACDDTIHYLTTDRIPSDYIRILYLFIASTLGSISWAYSFAKEQDGDRMYELDLITSDTIREDYQKTNEAWRKKHSELFRN